MASKLDRFVSETVTALGAIGVAEMRRRLRAAYGDGAVEWFDAKYGVEGPRYEHRVDTSGVVRSEEVKA